MSDPCPDDAALVGVLDGSIDPGLRERIEDHLDRCSECRQAVALLLQRDGGTAPIAAPEEKIGRYFPLEEIGLGGMGRVLRAFDPELGRDLALKVVRADGRPARRDRLLREARSMARLNHPNVVPIYDVGATDDGIYLAMELVEGMTLSEWLVTRRRRWREVVDVFVQAGQGLIAAHDVGLVHRDFKPDNVLVRDDGIVMVTDFGLAQTSETKELLPSGEQTEANPRLTRDGTVIGTPVYMSPEQHAGEAVDARSDQYAFCVALYEGLTGQRPFAGEDLGALARQKTTGQVPAAAHACPAHVLRALTRGLRPVPDDRWPSMRELLAALQAPRRLGWGVGALFIVLVPIAVFALRPPSAASECEASMRRVDAIWSDPRRDAVAEVSERTAADLDAFADAWRDAYREACTREGEERSARMRCLDDRLRRLDAVAFTLLQHDRAVAPYARDLAGTLPPIVRCAEASPPRAEPDGAALPRTDALRDRLARVAALRQAGRYREALEPGRDIVGAARMSGATAILAEAELSHGLTLAQVGRGGEAATFVHEAYDHAVAAGADGVAGEAAIWAAQDALHHGEDPDDAQRWVGYAWAAFERTPTAEAVPELITVQADIAEEQGDLLLAILHRHAATQMRATLFGIGSAQLGRDLSTLGFLHAAAGDVEVGLRILRLAIDLTREQLGDAHPVLGILYNNLGVTLHRRSEFADALEAFDAARAVRRPALGDSDPLVGRFAVNRSLALHQLERNDEALATLDEAVRIVERAAEVDHVALTELLVARGGTRRALGQLDGAEKDLRRALDLLRADGRGADPARYAVSGNLALVEISRGNYERALVLLDEALDLIDRRSVQSGRGELLITRCEALFGLGRWEELRDTALDAESAFAGSASGRVRSLMFQGRALLRLGDEDGLARLRSAVDLAVNTVGNDTGLTSAAQLRLAEALLERGEPIAARNHAAPALAYFDRVEPGSSWHARARYLTARTHKGPTALTEARTAAETLLTLEPPSPETTALQRWLTRTAGHRR